ncbi:MAG: hypothetical protein HQM12_11920 [SAR324 cluster bacterium]|nr:hypothetical protein [SAR324 cluster bacterium]
MSKIMIIFVCLGLLLGVVSSCLPEEQTKNKHQNEKIEPLSTMEIEASLPPNPLQYINGLKLFQ